VEFDLESGKVRVSLILATNSCTDKTECAGALIGGKDQSPVS